jgi:hypothetical protein
VMNEKYQFEKISDCDIWQKFVETTPEYTMFVSSTYLRSFGGQYKLYFVKKGIEVKAGFCLLLSEDGNRVILNELVIYSGIFFKEDQTQKAVKAKSERFEITEQIIRFITDNFSCISIALSTKFEDLRPFLWHNYGSINQQEIFSLDLRYTSYLNISELRDTHDEESTDLFKCLETLRQRNIRKARKEGSYTVEEVQIELFLNYYIALMESQNQQVPAQKLAQMSRIIENCTQEKQAVMFATKNANHEIIYLTVFSYDHYRAYYLFGAGNPNAIEHYRGTICFWDAFMKLSREYKINEVDLEGINSPQRGWFKLSFGGSIVPYYEVNLGVYE